MKEEEWGVAPIYLSVSLGRGEVSRHGDLALDFDARFGDKSGGAADDQRQFPLLRQADAEPHDLEQSPIQRLELEQVPVPLEILNSD